MSDKENPREESSTPTPSAEETSSRSTADESIRRPADQCHGRYLEWFKQSLSTEGETAYRRWGMPLFHSMSDEEVESQRAALGFELRNALDHYNRGCLLAAREDFAGAAKAFDRALQLDHDLAEALFNRALALEKTGEMAKARELWNQFIDRFGESEEADEVKEHLISLAGV